MERTGSSKLRQLAAGVLALAGGAAVVWFWAPSAPRIVVKEAPPQDPVATPGYADLQKAIREEALANAEHFRRVGGNPNIKPDLIAEDERLKTANTDNYKRLEWRLLRGLDVKTGEVSPQVRSIEGGSIKLPGYMVPFDDDEEKVSQFLLVPVAGMCIHLPPPPANQIILVEMKGEAKLVDWNRQIMVYGTLEVEQSNSPYGPVAYKINASVARAE